MSIFRYIFMYAILNCIIDFDMMQWNVRLVKNGCSWTKKQQYSQHNQIRSAQTKKKKPSKKKICQNWLSIIIIYNFMCLRCSLIKSFKRKTGYTCREFKLCYGFRNQNCTRSETFNENSINLTIAKWSTVPEMHQNWILHNLCIHSFPKRKKTVFLLMKKNVVLICSLSFFLSWSIEKFIKYNNNIMFNFINRCTSRPCFSYEIYINTLAYSRNSIFQ